MERELKIKITTDRSQAKRDIQEFQREQKSAAREVGAAEKKAWEETKGAIDGARGVLSSFAGQMVGLNSIQSVVGMIAQQFQAARQQAYDATRMVQEYHAALRELAALRGELGQTGPAMAATLSQRAITGQRQAEAIAYMGQALNVGQAAYTRPPGVTPPITESEFRRGAEMAGVFQTAEGGDAAAHASLYGTAAQLMGAGGRTGLTGEQVAARTQQYYKIMQPGGFYFSGGIQEFQAMVPQISTGVLSDRGALALLTALSTTRSARGGEAPSITFQHLIRATIGAVGKTTKARIEGGPQVGAYMKRIGITSESLKNVPADQQVEFIAERVGQDIDQAEREARARGEAFNPLTYATSKIGYGNQQDAGAILAYMGIRPVLGGIRAIASPEAEPSGKQVTSMLEEVKRTSPTYQAQQVELAGEAATIAIGEPRRQLQQLQQLSFNRLIAAQKIPKTKEQFGEVATSWWGTGENMLFGYRNMMNAEAFRVMYEEAKRVGGITPWMERKELLLSTGLGGREGNVTDEDLQNMIGQVTASGGRAVPGAAVGSVVGQAQRSVSTTPDRLGGPPAPMSAGRPSTVPGRVGEMAR